MVSRQTRKKIEELLNNLLNLPGKNGDGKAFEGAIAFKTPDWSIYASVLPDTVDAGALIAGAAKAFEYSIEAGKAAGKTGNTIVLFNYIIVVAVAPSMFLAVLMSSGQNLNLLTLEVKKTSDLIKKMM